jgi:Putative adhesin
MEYTFDTPGHVVADLRIPSGTIRVRTGEASTTTVRLEGGRDADEVAVRCDPAGDAGHRLVIEYRGKKTWGLFAIGRDLEVELHVPADTDLLTTTGSADLDARGGLARLEFRTGSGDLRFDNVTGDAKVKSGSGDVEGGSVGGRLACHGASGDVDVRAVHGDVTIRTASGDLELGEVDGSVDITGVSGDIALGALAGGKAQARSVSGDIAIGVVPGVVVRLDVVSTTGEVSSDLDASGAGGGDGADLEITASSVSGDISITRAPARERRI